MNTQHRRVVLTEASIGGVFSAVISLGFCLLIFGRQQRVPVVGLHGLIVDALPQTFMIALMATLVPTLLTQSRLRRGLIPARIGSSVPARWGALLNSITVAVGATLLMVGLHLILLVGPASFGFVWVATAKTLYGFTLGALLAGAAALRVIRER
jgi:hypothetical protein